MRQFLFATAASVLIFIGVGSLLLGWIVYGVTTSIFFAVSDALENETKIMESE